MNYKPENFKFIQCEHTRNMVASACMALNDTDWAYLRNYYMADSESYAFTNNDRIKEMMYKIQDAYGGGHSGSSIGYTMRIVDFISKRGLLEYQKKYMKLDEDSRINNLEGISDEDYIFYES